MLQVERMGAYVDGIEGTLSSPPSKVVQVILFCLWLCSRQVVKQKAALMCLGRLVRTFEFRRPLMGILNAVWGVGRWKGRGTLGIESLSELLRACVLMPLAFTNLRAQVDPRVTATDASEAGGGACISAGLTSRGLALARDLGRSVTASPGGPGATRTLSPGDRCVRVVSVCIHDGGGFARVALGRLPGARLHLLRESSCRQTTRPEEVAGSAGVGAP